MFNVSILLLYDVFKPATPLTNGVIDETLWQFAPLCDISQGSVATPLKCGGMCNDSIAKFSANYDSETISVIG